MLLQYNNSRRRGREYGSPAGALYNVMDREYTSCMQQQHIQDDTNTAMPSLQQEEAGEEEGESGEGRSIRPASRLVERVLP